MKKIHYWLIAGLLVVIIITAYRVGVSSAHSTSLAVSQSASSTESIFNMKAKCEEYYEKLHTQAQNDNSELLGTKNNIGGEMDSVYKVIYSPTRNSCLEEEYIDYITVKQNVGYTDEVLEINDVFTNDILWTNDVGSSSLKYWDAEAKLDQAVVDYQ